MNKLIRVIWLFGLIGTVIPLANGQAPQGQGTPSSGGRSQPGAPASQPSPLPGSTPRPLFLSGSVKLADDTAPPASALIELVCDGQVRPQGYSDSKGNFSFLVGQPGVAFSDASTGTGPPSTARPSSNTNRLVNGFRDLTGCEVQAKVTGFLSSTVILTFRDGLDDPNIGIIRLSPLTADADLTVSVTTASAPKDARNAYEKGLDNAKKQKWPDAERDFLKAVQVYPRYAIAWYELGRVYQQEKKLTESERAQNEAIRIDPKFIGPYAQLAFLSTVQGKWEDALLYSSKVIKTSAEPAADVYFASAVAHYNLKKIDIAKEHAREAAALDSQHKNPKINHLLGLILAQTQEYKAAEEQLRLYLQLAPNATESTAARKLLDELEKLSPATSR
jgi:tetratricopeptide (TPR) repeat protein